MAEIDRKVATRDAAGHGPDIGSDEWMILVGRNLGVYDDQGHGPDAGSEEWQRAIHRKAFGIEPSGALRVAYVSETGERLVATYDTLANSVTLDTARGRVVLTRAVSASGARYTAPGDEVFWIKGATATYRKAGELLFTGVEETRRAEPVSAGEIPKAAPVE